MIAISYHSMVMVESICCIVFFSLCGLIPGQKNKDSNRVVTGKLNVVDI